MPPTLTKQRRSRDTRAAVVTAVVLDPTSCAPLHRQVYEALRAAILAGRMRPGSKLPSTRALALHHDSEFRYAGRPLAALQGLSPDARVLYAGTFSKVLSSSLRLGYLVVPEGLVDAFVAAKALADVSSPPLEQAVVADFMAAGHFARHVRRMRVLYERRKDALLSAGERELSGLLELQPATAGIHLVGWLPRGRDDREAADRAAEHGVRTHPLSDLRIHAAGHGALLLGYAAVTEDEISEGARRLKAALR